MNPRYNVADAHSRALRAVKDDAEIGRLPFYDYTIEYCAYFEQKAPEPTAKLLNFLESCERIEDSHRIEDTIKSVYSKHSLEIPIGLMDLPVWWAKAIITGIAEVNWVEPDPERTLAVFGWTMVHRQGAYLDIQFPEPLPSKDEDWLWIGNPLMNLQRSIEPGPFTQPGRLIEFV